jgi:3-hydroxyacyl-CoA dehydrogenase/enoyl-CoA hydratase/3-hydroxybutyryl-CoA epimerase/3-hydroxyacyl-CoA dehydrogenase/enoyl-CoA hydratase/3-hydroxybutyryl-CoA epimerase/enoyl-CoA isomerase
MVGIDTALYAGRVMHTAFPERIVASPLLPAMVKAGRLGQKSGGGFYAYGQKGKPQVEPAVLEMIAKYRGQTRAFSADEITARLMLPMVLEATRILDDKIVRDPRDVDLGLIFGIGFPPFKGGLLFWADTLGAAKIVDMLKSLEYLGQRAQPTPRLVEMAAKGKTFYQS